jgi:iron complex transport system substrate-binding protein
LIRAKQCSRENYSVRRSYFITLIITISFALSISGKRILDHGPAENNIAAAAIESGIEPGNELKRIVSMAPSITEMLFAMGLGDKVAGVTRYCDYPPAALAKPKVGGYLDPNYEAILAIQPDLVLILPEQEEAGGFFTRMSLRTLVVDHSNVEGIMASIPVIGQACGAEKRAREIAGNISRRMESIRKKAASLPRPRVMVTVGRNLSYGSLEDVYISGTDGFYNELIESAGGVNVYNKRTMAFPTISAEGINELNPQIILEMVPNLDQSRMTREQFIRAWDFASAVDAVKGGRVYVLGEDYVVRPGPRFILLLEEMARAIHPEVDWEAK